MPESFNSTSDEYSIGLWQINTKSTAAWNAAKANCGPLSTRSDLYDPAKNAKCAKWKYNIQGFTAWSIYNNGYYRNQMAFADQWADFLGY
ncbi:transglycosylase SLT domain-containing protein [Candidatus Saccharibacteria bacterium]|nr:transglycosylase SLT domain-containing protein [Candidatus Saccharibacteria bacterium]